MEAWYNGAKVADVPVESGGVQVTARSSVRRQLTAVVPEGYWPSESSGTLAPYGTQLKVFQSLIGSNGNLIGPEVPVFAGRVEKVSRERRSGRVTVYGNDRFADVNDALFEYPRTATPGTTVIGLIISLVTEVLADADVLDLTGSTALIPTGIAWDTDRGQAIDDLAASIGAEVFCLPDGVTWIIQPVPTITGVPVWTLIDGSGGTLVRDAESKTRTDVPNRIIVHVEQPGADPILITVTDDNPSSPTRYGGPYGLVLRHMTNSLVNAAGQAQSAGLARLSRTIGAGRTRDVDTVPNPALEAGDVITVITDEGTEIHIADAFNVPFSVTDVMTINTRSTSSSTS